MLAKNERRPGEYTVEDFLQFIGKMDTAINKVAEFLPHLHKQIQYEEVLGVLQAAVNQPNNPESARVVSACGQLLAILWPNKANSVSTQINEYLSKNGAAQMGQVNLAPFLRDEMASDQEAVMLVFANLLSLFFKQPIEISDGSLTVKGKITGLRENHALHEQAAGLNVFSEPREVKPNLLEPSQAKRQERRGRRPKHTRELDSETAELLSAYIHKHETMTKNGVSVVSRSVITDILNPTSGAVACMQTFLKEHGERHHHHELLSDEQTHYATNASFWDLVAAINCVQHVFRSGHINIEKLKYYGSQS